MLAKTEAAGGTSLHPEVLQLTSSLRQDLSLLREDLVGNLAHLTMLARTGLCPKPAAASLKDGLLSIWRDAASASLRLLEEEDVHMAVESELGRRVGQASGFLHTARSRNDQVALDLRLHVRERAREVRLRLAALIEALCDRAEAEAEVLMPGYTHRQRAQPVTAGYWLLSFAAGLERDLAAFGFVLAQVDAHPLGVGALAGTTLPIDRELTRELLGFGRLTINGLDTVGDRDFELDFLYAGARFLGHAARFSTDVVDFSSREFGFLTLDPEIACGSSMMPQKKNPDVFELIRGKAGGGVGDLVSLLVTTKGLPGGYNRDLQEDRGPLLAGGARVGDVLRLLEIALPRIRFVPERCLQALRDDATQATDLAEALVKAGLPFRTAYKTVGRLVRRALDHGRSLEQLSAADAASIDAAFTPEVLAAGKLEGAASRKVSPGSPGPQSMVTQLSELRSAAQAAREQTLATPTLDGLLRRLAEVEL